MEKFEIDFYELSFLTEACIPPRPISRTYFWHQMINDYYEDLDERQRTHLWFWLNKNPSYEKGLKEGIEDVLRFEARYNPCNQYEVAGRIYLKEAYKFEGRYWLTRTKFIPEKSITNIADIQKTLSGERKSLAKNNILLYIQKPEYLK